MTHCLSAPPARFTSALRTFPQALRRHLVARVMVFFIISAGRLELKCRDLSQLYP